MKVNDQLHNITGGVGVSSMQCENSYDQTKDAMHNYAVSLGTVHVCGLKHR